MYVKSFLVNAKKKKKIKKTINKCLPMRWSAGSKCVQLFSPIFNTLITHTICMSLVTKRELITKYTVEHGHWLLTAHSLWYRWHCDPVGLSASSSVCVCTHPDNIFLKYHFFNVAINKVSQIHGLSNIQIVQIKTNPFGAFQSVFLSHTKLQQSCFSYRRQELGKTLAKVLTRIKL